MTWREWVERSLADLEATASLLEQRVAVLENPAPDGPPARGVVMGCWPAGSDFRELLRLEGVVRRRFGMFRERGGRGSLDTRAYKPGLQQFLRRAGSVASLEINCRLGDAHHYIPFARALSGEFDREVHRYAREIGTLPGTGHVLELQSEADLEDHHSGTPDEYVAFCRRVRRIFEDEGVTNVSYVTSLLRRAYDRGGAGRWIDPEVIDVVAVDAYSTPSLSFGGAVPGNRASPADIAGGALAFARSMGKPLMVCETGCQEDVARPDPGYKASWYRAWERFIEENRDALFAVVWNTSSDGPGDERLTWSPESSPAALEAFGDLLAAAAA